jgi:hypothetical protein
MVGSSQNPSLSSILLQTKNADDVSRVGGFNVDVRYFVGIDGKTTVQAYCTIKGTVAPFEVAWHLSDQRRFCSVRVSNSYNLQSQKRNHSWFCALSIAARLQCADQIASMMGDCRNEIF